MGQQRSRGIKRGRTTRPNKVEYYSKERKGKGRGTNWNPGCSQGKIPDTWKSTSYPSWTTGRRERAKREARGECRKNVGRVCKERAQPFKTAHNLC